MPVRALGFACPPAVSERIELVLTPTTPGQVVHSVVRGVVIQVPRNSTSRPWANERGQDQVMQVAAYPGLGPLSCRDTQLNVAILTGC